MRVLNRKIHFVFGLAILVIFSGGPSNAQSREIDAKTVLRKMTYTYARMSSYQDSGVVRRIPANPLIANRNGALFQSVALQSDTLVSFRTYYLRPGNFRFEWKRSSSGTARESVIWRDGRTYLWQPRARGSQVFQLTSSVDFEFQLDEALGPTLGSVFTVPSLLVKKATVFPFTAILRGATELSIVKDDLVDDEMCYVVRGNLSGSPWVLWIGKKSFLLRKSRTSYSSRSFHSSEKSEIQSFLAEEIHTNIRVNGHLPKRLFKYRPILGPQDVDLTKPLRKPRIGTRPKTNR